MTTTTLSPAYPAPKRPLAVQFSPTNPGATYVRVWCVDAPAGSAMKDELVKSQQSRLQKYEGDGNTLWTNGAFDKGGAYRFVAQEYTLLASDYGGSFEGDPEAAPSMTKVGAETSLVLYVGQRMTCPLGFGRDTATLVLYVWNDTIRPTTVGVQGELSPAIVSPQTPRATTAAATTSVIEALAALSGTAASSAIGTLGAVLADIIDNFNDHAEDGTVHDTTDTVNAIGTAFAGEPSPHTLARQVSEVLYKVRRHLANDDGTGTGAVAFHTFADPGPIPTLDYTNMPLFTNCSGLSDAYVALGDLWRAFEEHRLATDVHVSADMTHSLNPDLASPLLVLHREFIRAIAALSPTVPQTQSTAAVLLTQQAGFTES